MPSFGRFVIPWRTLFQWLRKDTTASVSVKFTRGYLLPLPPTKGVPYSSLCDSVKEGVDEIFEEALLVVGDQKHSGPFSGTPSSIAVLPVACLKGQLLGGVLSGSGI